MARQLEVWLFANHVGTLIEQAGRLSFSYAPAWLGDAKASALSCSLPLQAEIFDDQAARPFFAGLLPEGEQRKLIGQALQVSASNDFALLDGIGGECAGAVTFLEPGQPLPSAQSASDVRWLDANELGRLLEELPRRPMLAGETGVRLSLAGAQDKLPVIVDGERIGLPLHGAPSSHILKPAIHGVTDSVINEGFCMALAAALKLNVASTEIRHVGDQPILLVQRYDRFLDAYGKLQRLHQEDFCQALGIAPEYKYQHEGGPDFAQCFELLRRVTRPSATSILRLLDGVIFNALIGNHDAHGKNFSLLYTGNPPTLAPLYDLLSTAVYPKLTPKMAMKLGSKYRFDDLQLRHWEQFAQSAGLGVAQVKKRVVELGQELVLRAGELQGTQKAFAGNVVVGEIVGLIEGRVKLMFRRLNNK